MSEMQVISVSEGGLFQSPSDGAKFMASIGIPQIPLRGKIAFLPRWQDFATTDPKVIDDWAQRYPGYNFGSVAIAEPGGFVVLEVDSTDVARRYREATGENLAPTLSIGSTKGGHRWYKHTQETIELSNLSQGTVKEFDFSLRSNNAYCVSPGSIHPESGKQYSLANGMLPVEMPPAQIGWLRSIKLQKRPRLTIVDKDGNKQDGWMDAPIYEGEIHDRMKSIACSLRDRGLDGEEIWLILEKKGQTQCFYPNSTTPFPVDYEHLRNLAYDIAQRYPTGEEKRRLLTPILPPRVETAYGVQPAQQVTLTDNFVEPEVDDTELVGRPVWPFWVMQGTSIYDNLVAPACQRSSKYEEFIFMPAMQLMLNAMFGKVKLANRSLLPNMFVGLISPYGKFFKSSSCHLAQEYFHLVGTSMTYSPTCKNAEGKTQIISIGSTEGMGNALSRINANRAILYNDELSKFSAKANVQASSIVSDMLLFYEGQLFANIVKSNKESFAFDSGSYCFGWLWNTTDRNFNKVWSTFAGADSGLNDRMFFVVCPEQPKVAVMLQDPDLSGYVNTKARLEEAAAQGIFQFEDYNDAQDMCSGLEPRSIGLVEKMALYFAVDLGLKAISSDCVERAVALVRYREQATKFLAPIEAENINSQIQQMVTRELSINAGKMIYRQLMKNLHFERYGTEVWNKAIDGLSRSGRIKVNLAGRPRMVYLLKQHD